MKHIKYIITLCGLAALLSSCNSWLSETPFDKVPARELYTTEQGAREALNGLYMGMLNRSIHGGELTFGIPEALVQHYYIPAGHKYEDVAAYKYSSPAVKGYVSSIWNAAYKLIADCNVFLAQIEAHKGNYPVARYKLLRGEALALRTYLHFDLFRFFAPPYTDANKARRAIPYYDREMNAPADYMTVEQIVVTLQADLDEALALLAGDPVLDGTALSTGDSFWDYRNFRLNLYAAWILKARVCLHAGDKGMAYGIASALLEGKMPGSGKSVNFMQAFPSVLDVTPGARDAVPFVEVVFGMHDVNRRNAQQRYFSVDLTDTDILLVSSRRLNDLFNTNEDTRRDAFIDDPAHGGSVPLKAITKFQTGTLDNPAVERYPYRYEIIPLIKKSELYLIAAEASANDVDKNRWLHDLRLTRGYLQGNTGAFAGALDRLLQQEYDREFYAEGQYFHFLKRNGMTTVIDQALQPVTVDLVFPVPDDETYNRQ
jgi:hypothetical protein